MAEFDFRRWRPLTRLTVADNLASLAPPEPGREARAWVREKNCLALHGPSGWDIQTEEESYTYLFSPGPDGSAVQTGKDVDQPEPCCVFVSDDGTLADYELLGPLAADKKVPFVLAVVRDLVGSPDGTGYMDTVKLHDMAGLGCEIAGHSVSHRDLSGLSPKAAEQEVEHCVHWLRDQGWSTRHFVYPYGGHQIAVERAVARLCDSACLVTGGVARPPFMRTRVPRFALGSFFQDGVNSFEGYRDIVDKAVSEKRFIVWMLHPASDQHDDEQQSILRDLIDYITEAGMQITTLSEAWSMHGNLWESQPSYGGERILDRDGVLWEAQTRGKLLGALANRWVDSRVFAKALQGARKFKNAAATN